MLTKDAAERLGVTSRSVARLCKAGKIRGERRGRDWWIEEAEVERYAQSPRTRGRPKTAKKASELRKE